MALSLEVRNLITSAVAVLFCLVLLILGITNATNYTNIDINGKKFFITVMFILIGVFGTMLASAYLYDNYEIYKKIKTM